MTDISLIEIEEEETNTITVTGNDFDNKYCAQYVKSNLLSTFRVGHDFHSLLYNYMNELLFKFSADTFCTKKVEITSLIRGPEQFSLAATL